MYTYQEYKPINDDLVASDRTIKRFEEQAQGIKTVINGNTVKYIFDERGQSFFPSNRDRYITFQNDQGNQFKKSLFILNLTEDKVIPGRDVGQLMTEYNNSPIQGNNKKNNFKIKLLELEDFIKNELKDNETLEFGDLVITTKVRYKELKSFEEAIEETIDSIMYETAVERQNEAIDLDLMDVINELDLDADEILKLVDEVEEEY